MPSFLQNQVETYAKDVDSVLMREHEQAMVCRDVEELLEIGLSLFEIYERADASWRRDVAHAKANDSSRLVVQADALRRASQLLIGSRERALELVRKLEGEGFVLEGAIRFRAVRHEPFEQRDLDVPFTSEQLAGIAASKGGYYDPDDNDL